MFNAKKLYISFTELICAFHVVITAIFPVKLLQPAGVSKEGRLCLLCAVN